MLGVPSTLRAIRSPDVRDERRHIHEHPEVTKLSLVAIGLVLWLLISEDIDKLSFLSRPLFPLIYGLASAVFFMSLRKKLKPANIHALLASIGVAGITFMALLFDFEKTAHICLGATLACFLRLVVISNDELAGEEIRPFDSGERGQESSGQFDGPRIADWV